MLPAPSFPGASHCPQNETWPASHFPQGPPGLSHVSVYASAPSSSRIPSQPHWALSTPPSSHCGHQSPRSQLQRGCPKASPPCTRVLPGLYPALLFFTAFITDMILDTCLQALECGFPRGRAVCPCGLWYSQKQGGLARKRHSRNVRGRNSRSCTPGTSQCVARKSGAQQTVPIIISWYFLSVRLRQWASDRSFFCTPFTVLGTKSLRQRILFNWI